MQKGWVFFVRRCANIIVMAALFGKPIIQIVFRMKPANICNGFSMFLQK